MNLRANSEHIWQSLAELEQIGAHQADTPSLAGVRRLALSKEGTAARRLIIDWMQQAGLKVSIDKIGNIYAGRPGRDKTLSPVKTGSHIDSAPTGCQFDGAFGVLGVLEINRTLKLRHRRILAGAGHDAQEWARICPAAMVFVPGENDGISRNPLEYSTPDQCASGINTLLHTILTLTEYLQ